MNDTTENLTQALHTLKFTTDSLRSSLKNATALESLVILNILETAMAAQNKLAALISAVES